MSGEKNYGIGSYLKSILCGGIAGISVDLILFPLDTIKTRLQSKSNKVELKKVSNYAGLRSSMMASFPSAAAFFSTYDFTKYFFKEKLGIKNLDVLIHMLSATAGEASQAFGLYKGYFITLVREIPFGLVQYPLYEFFKKRHKDKGTIDLCLCGAKAGGIAAILTTPVDVIKTRIMTGNTGITGIVPTVKNIYQNEGGIFAFFKGAHVRFMYISIGGMIFFGSNEFMKKQLGFNKNV